MKNKQKILNMVKFSALAAITFTLSMVLQLGYITLWPTVSFTTVHIPVLVGAAILPLGYVAGLGLVFGIGSWIASFIYASQLVDHSFQNPAISVLPRILFAIAAFFIIHVIRKLMSKIKHANLISSIIVVIVTAIFMYSVPKMIIDITNWNATYVYIVAIIFAIAVSITTIILLFSKKLKENPDIPTSFIISTFVHSILVLTMIIILKPGAFGDSSEVFGVIISIMAINGSVEALLAAFIGTPILIALLQLEEKGD